MSYKTSSTAFRASRLTSTTFLIKEYNDVFSERPHIYAKIVNQAKTILIIDTGCGGRSNDETIEVKSLKEFIETIGIEENGGNALNEGGNLAYIVALTHCHYDHILGVEDFKDFPVLASGYLPSFLNKKAIPEHSLCRNLGIETPDFTPTLIPHMHNIASSERIPLGMTVLHTPGHTPDEIALYDESEMMLYVGDSLYEWEPIIFPKEGSIVTWFSSLDLLISFVKEKNKSRTSPMHAMSGEVLMNCGHETVLQPALELLLATKAYMQDVLEGREQVTERRWNRGEEVVCYGKTLNRFSLRCPERLVREAQRMRQ